VKPLGQRHVVGVHPGDVRAAGEAQGLVQGPGVAGVGPADQADAGVAAGQFLEDRAAAVGGTVIDDDELEVAEGLRQDALGRLAHVRLAVEHWHANGDRGRRVGHVRGQRRVV
jgi:hypothetical protein